MTPRPAFVVGTGRCGSTLLSSMLKEHAEILSVSELFTSLGRTLMSRLEEWMDGAAFWRVASTPSQDLKALLRAVPRLPEVMVSSERLAADPEMSPLMLISLPRLSDQPASLLATLSKTFATRAPDSVVGHLTALFELLRESLAKKQWLERSGGSLEYAGNLMRAWPQAKFVHLVRDGRSTALSMSRHPYFRVKLARHLVRDPELPVEECLRLEIPLHRFGAYWSALMLRGVSTLRPLGRHLMVVRYEHLIERPVFELQRLAHFLECPSEDWAQRASQLATQRVEGWRSLPLDARVRLEQACLPGMRLLEAHAAQTT